MIRCVSLGGVCHLARGQTMLKLISFSVRTFRPLGPSVTRIAWVSVSSPPDAAPPGPPAATPSWACF